MQVTSFRIFSIDKQKAILFDRHHGKGAFTRLCSMVGDSDLHYRSIGRRFGITRQRVAQIAAEMGVDGRRRQRQRALRTLAFQNGSKYPPDIEAVVRKLKRSGLEVLPYRPPCPSHCKLARTSLRTLLVNGVTCRVYCRRRSNRTATTGREYVRFFVGKRTRAVEVALFAFWKDRRLKLYVLPVRELEKLSTIWLPYSGRYALRSNKKPKRDWTVYEEAWNKLTSLPQTQVDSSALLALQL